MSSSMVPYVDGREWVDTSMLSFCSTSQTKRSYNAFDEWWDQGGVERAGIPKTSASVLEWRDSIGMFVVLGRGEGRDSVISPSTNCISTQYSQEGRFYKDNDRSATNIRFQIIKCMQLQMQNVYANGLFTDSQGDGDQGTYVVREQDLRNAERSYLSGMASLYRENRNDWWRTISKFRKSPDVETYRGIKSCKTY